MVHAIVEDFTATIHNGSTKRWFAWGAQPPIVHRPICIFFIHSSQILIYRKRFRYGKRPEYSVIHLISRYTVGILSVVASAC